jgi:hypothetical protein
MKLEWNQKTKDVKVENLTNFGHANEAKSGDIITFETDPKNIRAYIQFVRESNFEMNEYEIDGPLTLPVVKPGSFDFACGLIDKAGKRHPYGGGGSTPKTRPGL